jgi:hypothetical protein
MFTACSVYPNLPHVRFARLLSKSITRASSLNFRALFTHQQTKPRALNTAPTPPSPLQKAPKIRSCGTYSNMQLGMSACAMPGRGAHNDVCSSNNFLGIYRLGSTKSIDNTRYKLMCKPPRMTVYCLLLGSPTIGCYSGIVVLGVVRGKRVLD